ncbi:hypothetical protein [Picosynechococcus sp. PCC 73109]|uniref:hypothetical protein n=1 Tax=Picosynechococcus sp. PCC 73109 TaxID=374982 RepID=UPI00074595F6|nr:hypothetical protein [Picosynechococcus sp. PCC 73109]AMA09413.1 hypothetical protein AWQ23_08830 [Picosynechococcus sp. PCC 73109]
MTTLKTPITLHLDRDAVSLGGRLSGDFVWRSENPDRCPKKATVSILWSTEGRGKGDRHRVSSQILDPNMVLNLMERNHPFTFEIPLDAPISYDGFLFRLMWSVEVRITFPGLFSDKDTAVASFQVLA